MTLVIAHRGNSAEAPENTLAAIRSAIELGVTTVEVDLRRTSDGELVLLHDRFVQRTTNGRGAIDRLTWHQVRRLDAGNAAFPGERIPRLAEALPLLVASAATLVLDVKSPTRAPSSVGDLLRTLDAAGARQGVVVSSFDLAWLREFGSAAPDVRLAELRVWPPPWARFQPRATIVSVFWSSVFLDPGLVDRIHAAGRAVWAWTVEDRRLVRRLERRGVDGVITSRPAVCGAALG